MDVSLHANWKASEDARIAATAIEACVHCGFCLAACPTYLDTRDERDSPRGRIYLVKNLLENGKADSTAVHHLDRCLSCQSCETTCPSGVAYGEIVDHGRTLMNDGRGRSAGARALRSFLLFVVPRKRVFSSLLGIGRAIAPLLGGKLRRRQIAEPRG